jgi:hypothetical protein
MKLSEIKIEPELMMRVGINQEIVDEYAVALLDGAKFPPIVLFHDGDDYHLADGWKRYYSHKQAGLEIIDADVRMGTYEDAFDYALTQANHDNGERYSPEDKRHALNLALEKERYKKQSDRQLAKILRVSNTFVSKIRKLVGKQPDVIEVNRGGKKYTVDSPKKASNEPAPTAPECEFTQEDKVQEIASEMQDIVAENEKLQTRLAVAAMEATPEERGLAQARFDEMEKTIKTLEADNRVLKASRDSFQRECAELKKQVSYWERRAKKLEKEAA